MELVLATHKHQLPPRFHQDSNSCQDPAQAKNQPCRGSDEMNVLPNARHQQPQGSADAGATHATGRGGAPGHNSGSGSSSSFQAVDRAAAEAFLDADLSILAAPRERYTQYSRAVRLEYQHLLDEQFRCAWGCSPVFAWPQGARRGREHGMRPTAQRAAELLCDGCCRGYDAMLLQHRSTTSSRLVMPGCCRAGRTAVLERMLSQPSLYSSVQARRLGMEKQARENMNAELLGALG